MSTLRRQVPCLLIALFLLPGPLHSGVSAARQSPRLSLWAAVREAIAHASASLDARDSVTLAEAQLLLVESRVQPKFITDAFGSFGGSNLANQTYSLSLSQRFLTGTQIRASAGTASARNQLGSFYTSTTVFAVTQPLLRGFGGDTLRRERDLARLRVSSARLGQTLAEQQTAVEIAAHYYRIAAQSQLAEVADQALRRARALLEAAQAKLAIGKVSQLDVLRAEQLVAQAELGALDARTAIEDAMDHLRLMMGRDSTFAFTVDASLPRMIDALPLEAALVLAESRRLEIHEALAAVERSAIQADVIADQNRPQLDVTLQVARNGVGDSARSAFGTDAFEAATFAGVSIPFDRAPATAARRGAAIDLDRHKRQLADLRLRVAHEVRLAHRNQARLALVIEQADRAVEFAEQEAALAALRYQRGLSNNLDVVTAESNLLGARARRFGALVDLALARFRLRAAIGTLDLDADFR